MIAGATFGLALTAEDKYGNVATSFNSPLALTLAHNPGTGYLGGTLTEPASSGVAQFTGLALETVGAGYTITATNGSLTSAPSKPISVTAAQAASLEVYIPPPTSMVAGSEFGLAIAALDPFGNLATGYTDNISIALDPNPENAKLSGGQLTVAAAGGVANFHAFITDVTAASGYTLTARAMGLSSVTTGAITVTPASATQLAVISQPPALVTPGSTFGFTVAAEDQYGNIATGYTGSFTVAVPTGSGAVLGGTTTVSPTLGEVKFSGVTLTESSGAVGLLVSSTGLTGVTTNSVSVTTPAQVSFATGTVTVNETVGMATIQVVRSGGYSGAISVNVATSNGTAVAGVNYTSVNQVLNFAANQNTQNVMVPISSTPALSSSVSLSVGLSNPGSNATLGSQTSATVVIQGTNRRRHHPPGDDANGHAPDQQQARGHPDLDRLQRRRERHRGLDHGYV